MEARRQAAVLQAGYTQQQLRDNERAREAARQAEYLEAKLAAKTEREYQAKVAALLASDDGAAAASGRKMKVKY